MINQTIRQTIFWITVLCFLATAPVVIFYAKGYRFSLDRGIFIYTGSFTIKSNPQDSFTVKVDGKPTTKGMLNIINDSYHIGSINPGEHLLEVEAPGFNKWSKKAIIHSGISTEFWNILLTRELYPRTNHNTPDIQKFYLSPDREQMAVVIGEDTGFRVDILNINDDKPTTVFSTLDYTFSMNSNENIEWNPWSRQIIIPVQDKSDNTHYFIVNTETLETTNLKDIANTEKIKNARWSPKKRNSIYFISENQLYNIDTLEPFEKTLVLNDIINYDFADSTLFYMMKSSGIIYQTDVKNGIERKQITTSSPKLSSDNDNDYRIIAYDEDKIALIHKNGLLYIFNKGELDTYFVELSQDAKGVQFSDDGKKVLYWTDNEIFTYFTKEWEVQPYRNENEIHSITRFAQPIKNVQWAKSYEHIIFTIGSEVKIVELDHRGNRNTMQVIDLSLENPQVFSEGIENKLYFVDLSKDTNYLYSITFPEKTGLFTGEQQNANQNQE